MNRSEQETREQLIDPKLRLANWDILEEKYIIEKNKACIETLVNDMPISSINPNGNGYVDYVLFGDDGKPLALIEAKKSIINEEQGRVQACLYADCLERKYGIRPIIYYTNGYSIKILDGMFPAREVFGFHRKEELEYMLQKRNCKLENIEVRNDICGRYYQKDAITEIINNIKNKKARSLVVLATGTGKTRLSCGLSEILIRNNFAKRILFLADRKNLVTQAKEETYDKFLSDVPMATIIEGKSEGAEDARIVFSTYQSMLSIIQDTSNAKFGIGHFDLIITDEAHRSLFNKYAEIFSYFDALMIGLTATPRNDINKSTYKVFNIDNDTPNYEYDVVKAVKDGYLVYFRALDRTPDILRNGLTYNDLNDDEKEQYEENFTEDDGTLPERIEGEKFYSAITNEDTIRKVLKDLMEEGLRVDNGDTLGKTIIFARDHNHALKIQEIFRQMYPELCNVEAHEGEDYCVVIDNKIKHNDKLQRIFKDKQSIRIVISVDMMDTGVDIPEVVNLVFFKKLMSKIKFWQMIGRGTRLCEDLNVISPKKAYFERQINDNAREYYKDKQGFLIFDVCNVFKFFNLNPDGKRESSSQTLSLNQKIFMERVALYKALQFKYFELDDDDKTLYENLKIELCEIVKSLNKNYIGVQNNLQYVERYSELSAWEDFKQAKFVEIKNHIAPNVIGVIDFESARKFDLLCYKFSSSKLLRSKDFAITYSAIFKLVTYLDRYKSQISEVARHIELIKYIQTDEFLNQTNTSKMEDIRKELRDLIRFVEKDVIDPIITDFTDNISSTDDAEDNSIADFSTSSEAKVEDFKTLEDKTISFIEENPEFPIISKIKKLQPYEESDVQVFKDELLKLAKSQEDDNNLFSNDIELTIFIRKHIAFDEQAVKSFLEKQLEKRNQEQVKYIKELLTFINQNGTFKVDDLIKNEELHFVELFNSEEIKELINDINEIL